MQHFQILAKAGQGSFATVYQVRRKHDGLIYAMKKITLAAASPKQIANTLNEVRVLASIQHPHLLAFKEALYDQPTGCLLVITEFAEGGDLSALIQDHKKRSVPVKEQTIWKTAAEILLALAELHRLNIFHRDIKSANVMLAGGKAKLGDLNVSKISKTGLASTQTGTPFYASPQLWSNLPYNSKCDIWSLGCLLYEMATYRTPFPGSTTKSLKQKIQTGSYPPLPSRYSQDLRNFINLCLSPNPRQRPSARTLLESSYLSEGANIFNLFSSDEYAISKQNKNGLLQTIRPPSCKGGAAFANQLASRLPCSNYQSSLQFPSPPTMRSQSLCLRRSKGDPLLPEILRSRPVRPDKEGGGVELPRLLYLR